MNVDVVSIFKHFYHAHNLSNLKGILLSSKYSELLINKQHQQLNQKLSTTSCVDI